MKNRLKVLRAERDWTQAQLADRLEASRQTVNAIEKEKFDPSLPLAGFQGRGGGRPEHRGHFPGRGRPLTQFLANGIRFSAICPLLITIRTSCSAEMSSSGLAGTRTMSAS